MTPPPSEGQAALAKQCRHQVRVTRGWMPWWIPWMLVAGLAVSVIGLVPPIAEFQETRSLRFSVFLFGLFAIFFAWGAGLSLIVPYPLKPRIVPYFARPLGPLGGSTMAAFYRGRGLYREFASLEALAGNLGVRPLSAFGFNDDHYGQEVEWHAAEEGLRTVEALRQGLSGKLPAAPDVSADLETLAQLLRVAADQGTSFSLVLRLHAKDSLQVVCTREERQGSFW